MENNRFRDILFPHLDDDGNLLSEDEQRRRLRKRLRAYRAMIWFNRLAFAVVLFSIGAIWGAAHVPDSKSMQDYSNFQHQAERSN